MSIRKEGDDMSTTESQYSNPIFDFQQRDAENNIRSNSSISMRRGSSLFGFPTEVEATAYDQPSESSKPGSLLVDFPERDCEDFGYSQKRDYDDADDNEKLTEVGNRHYTSQGSSGQFYNSSSSNYSLDHDSHLSTSSNASGNHRVGEAARMEQLVNEQNMPGGKNYRPLVGGFAAAAYEAMRDHHFSDPNLDCSSSETSSIGEKINRPPPSI